MPGSINFGEARFGLGEQAQLDLRLDDEQDPRRRVADRAGRAEQQCPPVDLRWKGGR